MSPRARKVSFRTPMAVAVKVGHVVQLKGGQFAGVHDVHFRITGVKHEPKSGTTQIAAREMCGWRDISQS
ncbi:MAG TPA: hypothetical protein VM537_14920, partial [Anaerolineae bacterium]|nr:hypothetical protein [Anaerolineae bacterium]